MQLDIQLFVVVVFFSPVRYVHFIFFQMAEFRTSYTFMGGKCVYGKPEGITCRTGSYFYC